MKTRKFVFFTLISALFFSLTAEAFNEKLTNEERNIVASGEVFIKNINYFKNISLQTGNTGLGDKLLKEIDDLNPKYLAEVIQIKPYEGNEDLPQRLETILNNVPEYAGIPYFSY